MCIIRYFDKNYSRIYPDFYKPGEWVLDAKYKKITDGKISREDLFQLISYMHVMKIPRGGFIFPRNGLYPAILLARIKMPPQARMRPAPVMTRRLPACFLRMTVRAVPVPAAVTAAAEPDMNMSRTSRGKSSAEKICAANRGRQAPAKIQPVMTSAMDRAGIRSLCPASGSFCCGIFSGNFFFSRMKTMIPLMTAVRNETAAPVISSRQSRIPTSENGCLTAS